MQQLQYFRHQWITATLLNIGLIASASAQIDDIQSASMVRTWVFAAEGIAARCKTRFPSLAAQIDRDMMVWKHNDQVTIDRAMAIWRRLEITVPRTVQEVQEDQAMLNQLWFSISDQQPSDPPNAGMVRCSQYFQNRASGALRSIRPEVFKVLERR